MRRTADNQKQANLLQLQNTSLAAIAGIMLACGHEEPASIPPPTTAVIDVQDSSGKISSVVEMQFDGETRILFELPARDVARQFVDAGIVRATGITEIACEVSRASDTSIIVHACTELFTGAPLAILIPEPGSRRLLGTDQDRPIAKSSLGCIICRSLCEVKLDQGLQHCGGDLNCTLNVRAEYYECNQECNYGACRPK